MKNNFQESKALHKAMEGRKRYVTEVSEATLNLDNFERHKKVRPEIQ